MTDTGDGTGRGRRKAEANRARDGEDRERDPHGAERSELEEGLEHLGRAVGGVFTRLLGEKVTGHPLPPGRSALSPEADRVIDAAGETLGRWMRAAGEGMRRAPDRPLRAVNEAIKASKEPIERPEGLGPVTVGFRSLASGLYRVADTALDKIAPRKPKRPAGERDEGEPDLPSPQESEE